MEGLSFSNHSSRSCNGSFGFTFEMIRIDNVQQIKDFLIFTVKRFNEINISNFRSYFMIPKNEYIYWNKLTLFSFINAICSGELEIKLLNNSYEYLDYAIRSVEK